MAWYNVFWGELQKSSSNTQTIQQAIDAIDGVTLPIEQSDVTGLPDTLTSLAESIGFTQIALDNKVNFSAYEIAQGILVSDWLEALGIDSLLDAKVSISGDQLTGTLRTTEQTATPTGTTATLTLNNGNHQTLSLASTTGNPTITLTVPTSSAHGTIILLQHSTPRTPTFTPSSGSILWYGQPDWAAGDPSTSYVLWWRWNGSVLRMGSSGEPD